jgi:hypothetical protein
LATCNKPRFLNQRLMAKASTCALVRVLLTCFCKCTIFENSSGLHMSKQQVMLISCLAGLTPSLDTSRPTEHTDPKEHVPPHPPPTPTHSCIPAVDVGVDIDAAGDAVLNGFSLQLNCCCTSAPVAALCRLTPLGGGGVAMGDSK